MRTRIALLILALLPLLLITDLFSDDEHHDHVGHERVTAPPAPPAPPALRADGGTMIDERFDVRPGDALRVSVPDADVILETGSSDEVHLQVMLDTRETDRAYAEALNLQVWQQDGTVALIAEPRRRAHTDRPPDTQLVVRATIPSTFDVDIRTSDGDILADRLDGTISLKTSDGSIRTQRLQGPQVSVRTSDGDLHFDTIDSPSVTLQTSDGSIVLGCVSSTTARIRTSDGDIAIDELAGTSEVITSDGDIILGTARGEQIRMRSSDGEIHVKELVTARSELRTSEGSIVLENVEGSLKAITSSGDLRARLLKPGEIFLRTSDGDIIITAPSSLPASLGLSGEEVRIASDFAFQGQVEKERAEGVVNGGGARIEARTSDGQVLLRTH